MRTELGVIATGVVGELGWVAIYGRAGAIELRTLSTNRAVWTAPLIAPQLAPATSTILGTELDRAVLAPDGSLVVTYESPRAHDPIGHVSGGIVVRSAADGRVIAVYDVYGVTGLAIAPDSRTFVYATGAREVHRALARLPR
jgi:sugar lactone lactonase YvrE